jgi:hypothetical protein
MARALQQDRWGGRPRSVTLVGWGVFLLGLANGWRVVGLYRQLGLLLELDVTPDPRLGMIFAMLWAVLLALATVALWQGRQYVRWVIPFILFFYGLYQLFLAALFTHAALSRQELVFDVSLYGVAILFSIWALNRKVAREYFEDKHGQYED